MKLSKELALGTLIGLAVATLQVPKAEAISGAWDCESMNKERGSLKERQCISKANHKSWL